MLRLLLCSMKLIRRAVVDVGWMMSDLAGSEDRMKPVVGIYMYK